MTHRDTLEDLPELPIRVGVGIGRVGAGLFMRDVHLAAHREAGFDVVSHGRILGGELDG